MCVTGSGSGPPPPSDSHRVTKRQEGQPGNVAIGLAEPMIHGVAVGREGIPQHGPMFPKATARRAAVRHDRPDGDDRRRPTLLAGDVAGESAIAIDLSDEATDIADLALHFDNQSCPPILGANRGCRS
jgi:hypothetical protein